MTTAKFDSINVKAFEDWLSALEDGKILQAKSSLHEIRGGVTQMCCLGVVSHVHATACDLKVEHRDYGPDYVEVTYNGEGAYLPLPVAKYLGIPESHLDYHYENVCNILVELTLGESQLFGGSHYGGDLISVSRLNDSGMFGFSAIAQILRRNFLNVEETTNA